MSGTVVRVTLPSDVGRGWTWAGVLAAIFATVPSEALAEDEVRIAILDGVDKVTISGRELRVFDAKAGRRIFSSEGEGSLVLLDAGGAIGVRSSGRERSASRVLVEAEDAFRVGDGLYLGRIEVRRHRSRGRGLLVINRLPTETYLLGIIGSEMDPSWPIEALKAQTVAARTYALERRMRMRATNRRYDLSATVLSQVYKGAERISPAVIQAVESTYGEVLSFRRNLAETLYHSTCGGRTRSAKEAFGGNVPYLKPRECEWCRLSPRYRWQVTLPLGEVSEKLTDAHLIRSPLVGIGGTEAGMLANVKGRKVRLSPASIRKAMGYSVLYSERFRAETHGRKVHIHGRGYGHGVGMCQWGAHGMAKTGKRYQQILAHYYPDTRVRRVY